MKETLPIFFRLSAEDCWLLSLEPLAPCPASAGAPGVEPGRGQRCGAAQQRHEDLGEALATSAEAVGGDWARVEGRNMREIMENYRTQWMGGEKKTSDRKQDFSQWVQV
jgi:hypothetical protein